jgi:hypothetical protein
VDDPDNPIDGLGSIFINRQSEADALREALSVHRARMDDGLVDTAALRNVLTFFGDGGVGKTELSRQLAGWLMRTDESSHAWGAPPSTSVDTSVRWDVNDSRGTVDPLALLIAVRAQLGTIKRSWPAFDLAFGALFRALRPGQILQLRSPNEGTTTLGDVLAGLAGDALSTAGVVMSGGASAGIFGVGRSLLSAARSHAQGRRVIRDFAQLEELIPACEAASGEVEETATLAGRVAFLLTLEIERMAPHERPLTVVFVDHFERLQVPGDRHLGEAAVNRLVARLPYFLFVVTGRNGLRWYEPTPGLPDSGSSKWPLLSLDRMPAEQPRQNLIGYLSENDSLAFLEMSFERYGIEGDEDLLRHLAEVTGGWPLHLQTLVELARERSAGGRPIGAADLDGPLPSLIERLLTDLPPEEANAFRAACLLPYFDIAFVVAASEGRSGPVERLVQRQLVRPNEGSRYPYRIHDTLRTLVRTAGSHTAGGWGRADWKRHADLAIAESERRFNQAMDDADDLGAIQSLALGLNVATENNTFAPWMIDGIRRSPSIEKLAQELAPLIAAHAQPDSLPDLRDILEFLALRARARMDDVTGGLLEIVHRKTAVSSSAGIWRAYDLRSRGHTDEALAQLEQLLHEFGDRPELYKNQVVTTLRLARRYRDATERLSDLTDAQRRSQVLALGRRHGRFEGSGVQFADRVREASSRRFQVEQLAEWLSIRQREFGVTEEEVREVYGIAVEVGHVAAQANCFGVLAQLRLFDDEGFADCIVNLEELSSRRFQPYNAWPQALALRAWATEDDDLAARAHDVTRQVTFRSAGWCQTEILLEHLGHPLEAVESQWLEPYEIVRDRWLEVLEQAITRGR